MDFDLDLTEVDPERIGSGTSKFPVGQFHVQVISFQPWKGRNNDQTIIQLQSLAGSVPNIEGALHDEWFDPQNAVACQIMLQVAIACRVTTRAEIKKMKETTGRTTIDWEALEGRQFVVITAMSDPDKNGKQYLNLKGIFDVDDPKVAHVPKHEKYLERFRASFPLAGEVKGDPQASATQSPTNPAPSGDQFSW